MLRWIIILLVLALIAAVFGFGGLAEGFVDIAQILFYILLAVLAVLLVMRLIGRK